MRPPLPSGCKAAGGAHPLCSTISPNHLGPTDGFLKGCPFPPQQCPMPHPLQACQQPTSESYEEHVCGKHAAFPPEAPFRPLSMAEVLDLVQSLRPKLPATAVYTMESPVYLASNKAMRGWAQDKASFRKWRSFGYLLDHELRLLPSFEGVVYRAVDFRVCVRPCPSMSPSTH